MLIPMANLIFRNTGNETAVLVAPQPPILGEQELTVSLFQSPPGLGETWGQEI